MPSRDAWTGPVCMAKGRYLAWAASFRKVASQGDVHRMGLGWLFGRDKAPRAPIVVAFLVLMNALFLRIADPPALSRLRDIAFDNYQRLKPREFTADTPVRIVDIDEAALAQFGQWPWPRTIVARLVEKLAEKGAAVIAFDVVFAEPDRSSISQVVKALPDDQLSN